MVQIQQPNLLASIQQGLQVRNQRQQMKAQNALRQAASQYGYDSPQAMNALGALDQRAALQMDARRQSMDMRGQEHRLKMGQRLMQGVLSRPRGQWRQAYAQAYEQAGQMGLTLDGLPEPQSVTDDQIMAVGSALGIAPPKPVGGGGPSKAQETARERMIRYLEYARGLPPEERADVLSRVEGFENFRLAGGPTAEAPVISDRMIDMALLDLGGEVPEGEEAEARYRILPPEEAQAMGLPEGRTYQMKPDGKVMPVGGGGQTINVNAGPEGRQWGDPPKNQIWLRDADGNVITEPDPSGRGVRPVTVNISGSEADVEQRFQAELALRQADSMLSVIDGIIEDPQVANATGWGDFVPVDLPGLNARARGRMAQLQGQLFLQAYESLKGAGQITEVEGRKAEQAMARLSRRLPYDEYINALNDLRGVVVSARDRAQKKTQGGTAVIDGYTIEPVE